MDTFYKVIVASTVCLLMSTAVIWNVTDSPISDIITSTKISTHKSLDRVTYSEEDVMKIKQQRDNLSQALVKLSQEHLQLQCDMIPKSSDQNSISPHGGWCTKTTDIHGYYFTDEGLIQQLIPIFQGQTVVSFGEGRGDYKKIFDDSKKVKTFDGFDGAPFIENITGRFVKFIDLSVPLYGFKIYDWVMSLEVGEHIPKKYESVFLDNLANHAREGIVLSWAVPGQGGHGHVNCKSLKAVNEELDRRGFSHDKNCSSKLQSSSKISWIKANVNIYRRKTSSPLSNLWN